MAIDDVATLARVSRTGVLRRPPDVFGYRVHVPRYINTLRFSRRPVPAVHRVRHPVLVRARQLPELRAAEPGVRRVDDRPRVGGAVHTGIAVLPDPRGQEGARRGGAG